MPNLNFILEVNVLCGFVIENNLCCEYSKDNVNTVILLVKKTLMRLLTLFFMAEKNDRYLIGVLSRILSYIYPQN